jgi:acetoacetyl-CoA synthetase
MADIVWKPSKEFTQKTQMTAFTKKIRETFQIPLSDYQSLHQWSIENIESFWETFLHYTNILYSKPPYETLSGYSMPGSHWFSGMELNYAENIFARNFEGTALIYQIEHSGEENYTSLSGEYSFTELRGLVARCVQGLLNAGIKKGDKVAGYIANVPEAVVAALACASIGVVWSSASPDFGIHALLDRFNQIEPRLVFASTHYRYSGKEFSTAPVVEQLHEKIPSLETIVSVPYPVGQAKIAGDLSWREFLGSHQMAPPLDFVHVPFEHPLFILFSSGTTGAPKCMIHGTGGTLLQHRKELQLHSNLKEKDRLLFFTTCGWMMWNWQLSALSLGSTICLYDGSPGYPEISAIWKDVDRHTITHFGTSGRFLESCMKSQPPIEPGSIGDLAHLSAVLYTGSPLSPQGFKWVYETIKKDLNLAGISGGTDIISCFFLGNPNLPVVAGQIQCKGLGVDVAALDEDGEPVVGKPGELVCRKPIPSMPVGFVNDPEGKKYHNAYFDVYPGLWYHGDYVEFTPEGGVIIHGRSDATLNPGGVRIGSAEIYSALDHLSYISGAVVVGWIPPGQSDEIIILCVILADTDSLKESKEKEIKRMIRNSCSPRHIPHHIFTLSEVPITRSGKTVELSVKAILEGRAISNRNALSNPHVLAEIEHIRERLLSIYR